MKISAVLPFFFVGVAFGHHVVSNIFIDDVDQGQGTCLRPPPNTNPLEDLKSPQIACNVGGDKQVALTCPANGTPPPPRLYLAPLTSNSSWL